MGDYVSEDGRIPSLRLDVAEIAGESFRGTARNSVSSIGGSRPTQSGGELTADPPDAFADDDDSVHETNINKLAAAGVVTGTGPGLHRGSMGR